MSQQFGRRGRGRPAQSCTNDIEDSLGMRMHEGLATSEEFFVWDVMRATFRKGPATIMMKALYEPKNVLYSVLKSCMFIITFVVFVF